MASTRDGEYEGFKTGQSLASNIKMIQRMGGCTGILGGVGAPAGPYWMRIDER